MRGQATATALLASVLVALLSPSAAFASASLSPAARTVTSCVQQQRRLLVDFAIDRSGSLKSSDPDDRRVDGISAALIGLEGKTEAGGKDPPVRVEVLLSSFANDVAPKRIADAWHVLDEESLDNLLRQADHYGSQDKGRDTDYVAALSSARKSLDARAAAIVEKDGRQPCKVVVFLSDGRFEIGDRSGSGLPHSVFYARRFNLYTPTGGLGAVKAGERYLCRPGGLMDDMVGDGIVKFTVALSASEEFTRANRRFLESLTTGRAEGKECGSQLSPETGEFVEARDSRELLFVLGSIGGPSEGFCHPPGQCPNPSQFTTIPGLSGFKVTASSLPGVELALVGPAGEAATFSSGGKPVTSLSGASIHQHWIRDRSLSVEASFDPASRDWLGNWRFRFFVPGEADAPVPTYSFSLESDLAPRIVGASSLIEGKKTALELELVDHAGVPVDSGPLASAAQLQAHVIDGSVSRKVPVRRTRPGRFELPIRVPEKAPAGRWALSVETSFPIEGTPVEPNLALLPLPSPVATQRPSNAGFLALLALGLVALGLTLLFLYRRAQAKFIAPLHLRAFFCRAVVEPDGQVALDSAPGRPEYREFKPLRHSEVRPNGRLVERKPFLVRSRRRWRGRPFGEAAAPGRELIGGNGDGPLPSKERRSCRVPLDLAGIWLFAIDSIDGDGRVRGDLIVFTAEDETSLGPDTLEAARAALESQDWSGFNRGVESPALDLDDSVMDLDEWNTTL